MGIYIEGMNLPKEHEVIIKKKKKGEVYVYGSYPTELHQAKEIHLDQRQN